MDEADLADLRGDRGQALLARIAAAAPRTPADELRLATALRADHPAGLVAVAMGQHEFRCRAAAAFDRASAMYFTRAGLEQASGEAAARHRAGRFAGHDRLADLCTGIGGDLIALASCGEVLAVDRDSLHLAIAVANARAYDVGHRVLTVCADVRTVSLADRDAVFVDPARRAGGRRLGSGRSEPPLDWCLRLADAVPAVGIKAAPGLSRDTVPAGWETEFVAVGRELREAALYSPALATATTRATVLPAGATLTPAAGEPVGCRPPGRYLLDPNPAVTRAGLVQELARAVGGWQLDRRIAFLSADVPMRTPFGRCLEVLESLPFDLRALRQALRRNDIGTLDIRRRGLAGDVEDIRRRLRPVGSQRATLAMTRAQGRPWALLCRDSASTP